MSYEIGSTATRPNDNATSNYAMSGGIVIKTKNKLAGLRIKISNLSQPSATETFRLLDELGNELYTKSIADLVAGDIFEIEYELSNNTTYILESDSTGLRVQGRVNVTEQPYTSEDIDIIGGSYEGSIITTGTVTMRAFTEVTALVKLPDPIVNPKFYKIVVDDVDFTNFVLRTNINKKNRPVQTCTIIVNSKINDTYTIDKTIVGNEVTVQRGKIVSTERDIFRGEVISYKKNGSVYELICACKMNIANRIETDYVYDREIDVEAGVGSEIVKSLFDNIGINYTNESVPTTGAINTLKTFLAKGKTLKTLQNLADIYGRRFFYRSSDDLGYFIEKASEPTDTELKTTYNIAGRVVWNETGEDIINSLTITGGKQLDWATETFAGPVDEVTLTVQPIDTEVSADSVELERGPDSSDPKDFYVDVVNRKIIFTTTRSNIIVRYSYSVPIKVNVANQTSINNYYKVDRSYIDTKLLNTDDAELSANGLIESRDDVLTSAPIRVIGNNDIEIGQEVLVKDTINDINMLVSVEGIEIQYPFKPDKIDVGITPMDDIDMDRKINERLTDLEKQLSSVTDVNVTLINNLAELGAEAFVKVEVADADTDVLYFDSDVQGDWDDFDWGSDTEESYVEYYKESGYDD